MAKKMYFQVKPESFKIYDKISREGKIELKRTESFDVDDEYYNRMILVAKKRRLSGRINVKEQITGTKFVLKVVEREGKSPIVKIYSNKLELRTYGELRLEDVSLEANQAAGFYYSFRAEETDDAELNEQLIEQANQRKEDYVGNVIDFFDEAKYAAKRYKNDIKSQDIHTQRNLKQLSRKLR